MGLVPELLYATRGTYALGLNFGPIWRTFFTGHPPKVMINQFLGVGSMRSLRKVADFVAIVGLGLVLMAIAIWVRLANKAGERRLTWLRPFLPRRINAG